MARKDPQLEVLEQIASSLRELVQLTRVMSYPASKQILQAALDTEQKRLVYHALDGTKNMTQIQELTGVNARYVSEWGQEWEKIGIVEPSTVSRIKGRRQRSFELSMFGIAVPEIATRDISDDTK